ncbi:alkaline phosphatase family protein [Pontibacterium granulatum]|uniref:alkaline phosphatase family protein n=1 Tax=Pontibacterium granulatum TaxID=2036029 RepID=UPI002499EDAD|nr:alkaline phosphatase family protein [Pontibacterium granulatum]MDI3323860.1 alkaline phosphatase family protein [Pontibacterium granulatum]
MTKNILWITADQWRGDSLGCAGNSVIKTPHIDALAADGVRFARHYSPSSPCGPSRATMLTGMYPHNHRMVTNGTPLDGSLTNIALEMRKQGYDPQLFGYTDVTPDPRHLAAADPELRSFEGVLPGFSAAERFVEDSKRWLAWLRRQGYEVSRSGYDVIYRAVGGEGAAVSRPALYSAEHSDTAWMTDRVIDQLRFTENEPFFYHVSYLRPHPPFVAPEPYNRLYDPARMPLPTRADNWEEEGEQHPYHDYIVQQLPYGRFVIGEGEQPVSSLAPEEVQRIRAVYYGLISEIDAHVGRLIQCLKAEGLYDDTLIILSSDHGELLGDHHMFSKENYFESCYHIPLIIKPAGSEGSGWSPGAAVDAFTESIDLMPTILDLCGYPVPAQCDGRSLRPLLQGQVPANWRDAVYALLDFRDVESQCAERYFGLHHQQCNFLSVRDEYFKYVHFAGLPNALYDLSKDPNELNNVAADPAYQDVLLRYSQKLLSWRVSHDKGRLDHMKATANGIAEGKRRFD